MAEVDVKALPPIVMSGTVELHDDFVAAVRRRIAWFWRGSGRPVLEEGPVVSAPNHSLHANSGPVFEHDDGAGYTYGLVVIADGEHFLKAGGQRLSLQKGDVFRINSDETHSTECADKDALLAFVAMDFFHSGQDWPNRADSFRLNDPSIPLDQYGQGAVDAIQTALAALPRHLDKGEG